MTIRRFSSNITMPTDVQAATLTNDEILRYSRHLIMPEVGMEGQQKLKAARVLCVGAGGLGSPLPPYLAAAGGGTPGPGALGAGGPARTRVAARAVSGRGRRRHARPG